MFETLGEWEESQVPENTESGLRFVEGNVIPPEQVGVLPRRVSREGALARKARSSCPEKIR